MVLIILTMQMLQSFYSPLIQKGGSYTLANIPYPNTKLAYNYGYYSFAGWYMLVITKDKSKQEKHLLFMMVD